MDLASALVHHHGLAHITTLHRDGVSSWAIRGALRTGEIERPRRGWVATPDTDPDLRAAVAAGGRLGCATAAAMRGLWMRHPPGLHLSIPRHSGHARPPEDAVVHWRGSNWSPRWSAVDPIEQIIADLPSCLPGEDALAAIESAIKARLITAHDARRTLTTTHRLDLAAELDGDSGSGIETLARIRLRRAGIPVRTQAEIGSMHVDLLIGERLAVECDGHGFHDDPAAQRRDHARDLRLIAAGYVVVRLDYRQIVRDWALSFAVIRSLVARGEHRWTAAHRRGGLVAVEV